MSQERQLLFTVLQVQPEERLDVEQLGSKPKFWFERGKARWLFKEARENTGEDWAEKIASEIAALLGIAAATVELASFNGKPGCASCLFVNRAIGQHLIHGNELLAGTVIGYDRNKRMHQTDHTLGNIYRTITTIFPKEEHQTEVLKKLASYLILDALISNTDRHHENWGLLLSEEMRENSVKLTIDVAPSFDHASSLGRELRDERRINILQHRRVGEYVRAGKGGIYLDKNARHGANPLRIAEYGARQYPQFFRPVLNSIADLSVDQMCTIMNRVPVHRMSSHAREFAKSMFSYSLSELQRLNQ